MPNSPEITSPRTIPYVLVDVFTRTPLTGNQLAVFLDGRGLSDAQMQALARETRLPETTFIIPREPAVERERGVKVRIFTVEEELPFAGHPTLGTAYVLERQLVGLSDVSVINLDLKVGKVPVTFNCPAGKPEFGEMRQRDPEFGQGHDRAAVARAIGIESADIHPELPIETVSTGMAFVIVPMRSVEVLRRVRGNWPQAHSYLVSSDARFFYFVARDEEAPRQWHARMIFYNGEDPATGSAAGCFASWMVQHDVAASDEQNIVEQGMQVSRPSELFVRAEKVNGMVTNVRVGGYVVEVARGEFFL
jgi:trans-2,3-dihydro-3-hydroxyanthranilate isomerase